MTQGWWWYGMAAGATLVGLFAIVLMSVSDVNDSKGLV
jgi:hypothetical protein